MRLILVAAASIMAIATPHEPTWSDDFMGVRGIVIDEATQRPLARARVQVRSIDRRVFTDSAGRYRLDSIAIGDFSVETEAIGYIREIRDVVAPSRPHVFCGGACEPWKPVVVLNFYMRREPEAFH